MFSSIKTYGIAILAVLLGLVTALFYRSKAKYESARAKGMEQVMKTERQSTAAMVKGLDKEAKAREEIQKRIAEFARGKRP